MAPAGLTVNVGISAALAKGLSNAKRGQTLTGADVEVVKSAVAQKVISVRCP